MRKFMIITALLVYSTVSIGQNKSIAKQGKPMRGSDYSEDIISERTHENQREKLISLKHTGTKSSRDGRATYQKLDSIISENTNPNTGQWTSSYKSEYTYDAFGNNILELLLNYDSLTNQWVNQSSIEYGYDVLGNEILNINSVWDTNNGVWVYSIKIETTIDNPGNTISIKRSYWNPVLNNWRVTKEEQSIFDVNNNIIEFRTLYMDTTTNQLYARKLETYTYNGNGDPVLWSQLYRENGVLQWDTLERSEIFYFPNGDWESTIHFGRTSNSQGQLEKLSKRENGYDANGNRILFIKSDWNGIQWVNNYKYEYTFNSNGATTGLYQFYWDGSGWQSNHKTEYTYDINDNLALYISWYNQSGQWENGGRTVQLFDANSNMLEHTQYSWRPNYNHWDPSYKVVAMFNLNYRNSDLLVPTWIYNGYSYGNNMITNKTYFTDHGGSSDTTVSKNVDQTYYYYSTQYINSISEFNDAGVSVYPIPFTSNVHIDVDNSASIVDLTVFDMQGREVFSRKIYNHENVDLSELNSGMYIYTLKFNNEVVKGKLVKR